MPTTVQNFTRLQRLIGVAAVLSLGASLYAQSGASKSSTTIQSTSLTCTTTAGSGTFTTLSWSLGAENTTTSTAVGKTLVQNLNLTKQFDECSAALFKAAVTGSRLGSVTLAQHEASSNAMLMKVDLKDVFVSAYQLTGSAGTATPSEQISLSYTQITITNVASGTKSCWDTTRAAACN